MLSVHAIRCRRERWVTPDGQTITAPLPEGTTGHFGPELHRFVLMLYHQGQSSLPRLTALLQSVGVSISQHEIQLLLTEGQDGFLAETCDVLRAGLATSPWLSADDYRCATQGLERLLHTDWQPVLHLVRHARIEEPLELSRPPDQVRWQVCCGPATLTSC